MRDEEAFAAIVRRHGPMVLAVCRRVLGNPTDADDAFQAAFLVLLRKAGTLGTRRPLGPWLHGVAFNTSRRLQRANRRRAANERTVAELPERAASEAVSLSFELLAILDEELSRLPERYRVPIVLCDLEGLSRRQAAMQLGCPEGTVAGRLAQARALLATRLAARGVAPSAGVLAVLLTQRSPERGHAGSRGRRRACSVGRPGSGSCVVRRGKGGGGHVPEEGEIPGGGPLALRTDRRGRVWSPQRGQRRARAGRSAGGEGREGRSCNREGVDSHPAPEARRRGNGRGHHQDISREGVVVAAIPDERSSVALRRCEVHGGRSRLCSSSWGDSTGKSASRIRLDRTTDCRDTARVLTEVFNGPKAGASTRVTIVPVPDENAILVYATPIDVLSIRSLVKALDEGLAPQAQRVKAPARTQPRKYTFSFRNTPWAEVLAWYAKESGLTPILTDLPTGNVTIAPPKDRKFTLAEITDLINESLMAQKFILIRRSASFFIHPADEKIDPTLVPRIELRELKTRGKTELVQVVITVPAGAAAALIPEVRKLLTTFGSVERVKDTLIILDTAGNVTRIHELLQRLNADNKGADRREASIADLDGDGKLDVANASQSELRKYAVAPGTADPVAKALLAVNPKLRCIAVQAVNEIWVMATPEEHAALANGSSSSHRRKTSGRDK